MEFNPLVFEIFSISSFDPKLELLSMSVSSNRLDSLDDASVMWLKDTATVTDPAGNPWKCFPKRQERTHMGFDRRRFVPSHN